MKVYLGLGSNVGNRKENLTNAVKKLQPYLRNLRLSPVIESAAVLPSLAPAEWNCPYLNCVAEGETDLTPIGLLDELQHIEAHIGRVSREKWAPRVIDIDILTYADHVIDEERLKVPHPEMMNRGFVLSPLCFLNPFLKVPGLKGSVYQLARCCSKHYPLWMGIFNITPDSFAENNPFLFSKAEQIVDSMLESQVHIIDLGAESTRPGATPIEHAEEWTRLQPVLELIFSKIAGQCLRPLISVDTRHYETAELALNMGVDIINDVSGFTAAEMIALQKGTNTKVIAMHNLGLPANTRNILPVAEDPIVEISKWLSVQMAEWQDRGVDLSQIIFDPGIGFGKNFHQSQLILRNIDVLFNFKLPILIGQSRKSFMNNFAHTDFVDRDWETVGSSLALAWKGVHILRVHNVAAHMRAFRAWDHSQ